MSASHLSVQGRCRYLHDIHHYEIAMSASVQSKPLRSIDSVAPIADIMRIVDEDGGVVVKGLLSADQVARFNLEVDPGLQSLSAGARTKDAYIQEFHGTNTKRLTGMINRSKIFREEVIDNDTVHALANATMLPTADTFWMTAAQVIEIGPGSRAQPLHRDLENYSAFIGAGPSAPEVACNCLIALTEFTAENGATRVIPESHLWPDFEYRGTPEMTVPAIMNAGDALFIRGKTVHSGGANVTKDFYRRAVSFAFNAGWLVPEEAYPLLVSLDLARTLSPRVQQLLGFRSHHNLSHGAPGLWQGGDCAELADYLKL
jgi:ectoine hydroxylase-related dioxygenase (phytanoyl-CoA dioxygenase family)